MGCRFTSDRNGIDCWEPLVNAIGVNGTRNAQIPRNVSRVRNGMITVCAPKTEPNSPNIYMIYMIHTRGKGFSFIASACFQLHFSCSVDFCVDLNQNDGYYTPFVLVSLYISWLVSNIVERKQPAHTLVLIFCSVCNWCSRKVYKSFIRFVSALIVSHWMRCTLSLLAFSIGIRHLFVLMRDVHNTLCINVHGSNALHSTRRYRSFTSCRSLIALLLCSLLLFFRLCSPRTAAVRQPFHQPS